jgi:hypothetical protein
MDAQDIYDAEEHVFGAYNASPQYGERFGSRGECERFVRRACNSKAFRRHAPGVRAQNVSFAQIPSPKGNLMIAQTTNTSVDTARITAPREMFLEWVLCHEVAHAATWLSPRWEEADEADAHGPKWIACYVELLTEMIGPMAGLRFEAALSDGSLWHGRPAPAYAPPRVAAPKSASKQRTPAPSKQRTPAPSKQRTPAPSKQRKGQPIEHLFAPFKDLGRLFGGGR